MVLRGSLVKAADAAGFGLGGSVGDVETCSSFESRSSEEKLCGVDWRWFVLWLIRASCVSSLLSNLETTFGMEVSKGSPGKVAEAGRVFSCIGLASSPSP